MFSIDSGHELGLPGGFRPDDFLGCAHGDLALAAALTGDYSELDALPEPVGDGEMVG